MCGCSSLRVIETSQNGAFFWTVNVYGMAPMSSSIRDASTSVGVDDTIARHVWIEGLLTGVLSWVFALALAAPVTAVLEAACGRIFFRVPLDFHMAPSAAVAWLGLVVVIASLASALPARRAAQLPVREALAHV